MSFASYPLVRMLTDGNGHVLGWATCICGDLLYEGRTLPGCPCHEAPDVADVRGIDVEQATQEQMSL